MSTTGASDPLPQPAPVPRSPIVGAVLGTAVGDALGVLGRNLLFLLVVLAHVVRRCLPPY
jgi:hypothetical protein